MSEVRLRRASLEDCAFVWETNNEVTVRAQSVRREPIPYGDHERWFASKLSSPETLIWIAEDGAPVGVVRCDRVGTDAEISIAVAKDARGRGLGTAMIARASEEALATSDALRVVALLRSDNEPSRRAFERAGFARAGTERRGDLELLRYVWARP